VVDHYRGGSNGGPAIYTDPIQFFGEATFPTQGLKDLLGEVFARLSGDNSVPAIHRLETAFGGGKTHSLISCTHIAQRGTELVTATADLLDAKHLPEPGTISVVGIAGDEVPVHQPKGKKLVPFTLWGEIASQIGGIELYQEVEDEATSRGAPGTPYFDAVFGGRKVLIMLDELAQYTARLEAAHPHASQQLAAFLMSLFGHAMVCEDCIGHREQSWALASGQTVCVNCTESDDFEVCSHCEEEAGEGASACCECGAIICPDCWGDLRPGFGPQLKAGTCTVCGEYLCQACAEELSQNDDDEDDNEEEPFTCSGCTAASTENGLCWIRQVSIAEVLASL
jgi:hypothetical protein